MGSTKIIVVQLKHLIKNAVFVILGVILIGLLIYLFLPKDKSDSAHYTPGTYTSQIELSHMPVNVEVTVTKNKITSIELKNLAHEQEVFYPLMTPTMDSLAKEIVKTQSLDVNIASENTMTGQVLLQAIKDAVTLAQLR